MKKQYLIGVLVLLFMVFVNSFAQMGPMGGNPEERMKRMVDEYKTRLKLTSAQATKLNSILTNQMKEMEKLRESSNGDFSSMRTKMEPIREKTEKAIQALLNADQKKEYAKMQEERRQRMRNMGGGF